MLHVNELTGLGRYAGWSDGIQFAIAFGRIDFHEATHHKLEVVS